MTLSAERGVTPAGVLTVPYRFQAPPVDRYGRDWTFNWDTYTTIGDGEHARANGAALKRPSFSTMIVDEPERWLVWDGTLDAQRLIKELRLILEKPAPFRLVVSQPELWGPEPLTNMLAVFVSIKAEQRGGEIGTEYADVEFLEFKRERLTVKSRRPSEADNERRYTPTGQALYGIAREVYKQASYWTVIRDANGIKGVSPDDGVELAKWMKDHGRKSLKIPPLKTFTSGVDAP